MFFVLILGALGTVGAHDAATGGDFKLKWSDCGTSDTYGKVTDFSPTSYVLGDKITVIASGTLNEAITGGSFVIEEKAMGGLLKESLSGDICQATDFTSPVSSVTWEGLNCPVSAGSLSMRTDVWVSGDIPASLANLAQGEVIIKAKSNTGDSLLCLKIEADSEGSLTGAAESTIAGLVGTAESEATKVAKVAGLEDHSHGSKKEANRSHPIEVSAQLSAGVMNMPTAALIGFFVASGLSLIALHPRRRVANTADVPLLVAAGHSQH